jgi:hypothetical protein
MTQKMMTGYEKALPWLTMYGLGQSFIDAISFHLSNYLLYSAAGKKTVAYTDLWQTGIFFAADLFERNYMIPSLNAQGAKIGMAGQNGMIAGLSFIVSSIIDWLAGKNIKLAIQHNLVSNAVGFASNMAVSYTHLRAHET